MPRLAWQHRGPAGQHRHHRAGLQRLPCSEQRAGVWGTAPTGCGSPGRALSLSKGRDQPWGNTEDGERLINDYRGEESTERVRTEVQIEGKRRVTGLSQAPLAQPSKQVLQA